ncbi:CoA-disulfide reductase [Lentibacillus sp. JNUCC-1]|uniref:FAD-dependent oxidoreductase n=1 Tax=Lentibacillus sp. JNUCC-1 TaxID=2654513 RepID=UPI0012E851C2|nr:FAD-dependent oxidoreductase [Lentibacillus sp. JNUCC-1]MUV38648.1 CoA-disulfide reductase [Lentibacillus sp. JNUCC-1]
MSQTIVIVGAIAGGATTAAQLRRMDDVSHIILLDQNEEIAVSTCGLPYYIGDVVESRDDLYMNGKDFAEHFNVDVRTGTKVTGIDRSKHEVSVTSQDEKDTIHYDKLILSPGATASVPPLDGINMERTFTLHDLEDMDKMDAFIRGKDPQNVVIVGASFVGLEMAENLVARGLKCTMVDRSSSVFKLLDPDMGALIQDHLEEKGVDVLLEEGLESFSNDGKTVHLSSGKQLEADMTILAVGIKQNTALAEAADLEIGSTGGIKTNQHMQTNDDNIYAIGDSVEIPDAKTGTPRHVALAGPAHRQAFIVASHIAGEGYPYGGTIGTGILKAFDLDAGATGLNSAALDDLGRDYSSATLEAASHASYFPGAEPLTLKMLFDTENGEIYGGQVVGKDGVDKRLAVFATAVKAGMSVTDLTELEIGYAPPYSGPKDPINIIAYKAQAKLVR